MPRYKARFRALIAANLSILAFELHFCHNPESHSLGVDAVVCSALLAAVCYFNRNVRPGAVS